MCEKTPVDRLCKEIYDLGESYEPEELFEAAARIVKEFLEAGMEMIKENKS